MLNQLPRTKNPTLLLVATLMFFALGNTPASLATTVNWSEPDLDTWIYRPGQGVGGRADAPSFSGGLELDAQNEFVERTSNDPARLGTMMMAFDTSSDITTGLLPERYSIQSVTITTQLLHSYSGTLYYEDQAPTPAGYLDDFINTGIDTQQAMEIFGVGFREGYTGYDFTGSSSDPALFKESTSPYSASDGGYVPYSIVGDSGASGQYHDASNNITGGFSATDSLNHTDPFQADPWAIGDPGLTVGSAIALNTTFSFDVNLSAPGVINYLQQSLSDGGLGFILSSMHALGEFGGSGAAPAWYTKEGFGAAPTLEIEYSLLPIPGDFDTDGDVDTIDYNLWQTSFGQTGGYDGNDFLDWQRNFNASLPALATAIIPEPASLALLLMGVMLVTRTSRNSRNRIERTR